MRIIYTKIIFLFSTLTASLAGRQGLPDAVRLVYKEKPVRVRLQRT